MLDVIDNDIKNKIYEIRGKQVMLDSDLAKLYHCKNGTKDINKAVKRNINRFPDDFYFELTSEECSRFQTGTLNVKRGQNIKYLPHAFTEEGVAMLSSILHTEVAEEASISIMRAFVAMRHYIGNSEYRISNLEMKSIEHDNSIKLLQESFNKFEEKKKINEIYFEGQIYDARSKILDICSEAKNELIIIDSYADYNILDDMAVYHCGTSINRIGYKTFSITLINDIDMINALINNVNKILYF